MPVSNNSEKTDTQNDAVYNARFVEFMNIAKHLMDGSKEKHTGPQKDQEMNARMQNDPVYNARFVEFMQRAAGLVDTAQQSNEERRTDDSFDSFMPDANSTFN